MECQQEPIPCPYSKIGCEEQMYQCDVKTHEEKHKQVHLDLSMKRVLSLTTAVEEMKEHFEEMKEQLAQQKNDIDSLVVLRIWFLKNVCYLN